MTSHTAISPTINAVDAVHIRIRGTVQGVGFRPTVWRVATGLGLVGSVRNDAEGVWVQLQGRSAQLDQFADALRDALPPLARLDQLLSHAAPVDLALTDFSIANSAEGSIETAVCADAAVCEACLNDIHDPNNRRYHYAFTNCTHCGPRFSITESLPYDRANTTMAAFTQCEACAAEYRDPSDRRFHAQPNACPDCGPTLWFEASDGQTQPGDALAVAATQLAAGKIIAIKGIGGFHLACDATNPEAIARLRQRKQRPVKPLALMARDEPSVRRYVHLSDAESAALASTAAPIVVLRRRPDCELPDILAPGMAELGMMLPYSPLHQLLLDAVDTPLVMTSGNASGQPQCTRNTQARTALSGIADGFIMHDRDIANRIDDSVVRLIDSEIRCLRRARGYAPAPITAPHTHNKPDTLIGMGAGLKNTFCVAHGESLMLSQHIGDLESASHLQDLEDNLQLWQSLFDHQRFTAVIDQHPDYLSSLLGQRLSHTTPITVQHHHAHLAACLGDNGVKDTGARYLGVILDGLGYGADGTLWGGELLLGNYRRCERVGGLRAVALPGGVQAVRQPWRNLYARLSGMEYWAAFQSARPDHPLNQALAAKPLATLDRMLASGFQCPPCSSAGRLFDAVAAALGIAFDAQSFEGEAAMQLEALASQSDGNQAYPFSLDTQAEHLTLCDTTLWPALLLDLCNDVPAVDIAGRFHRGLAMALCQAVASLASDHEVKGVALSGGVFQNRLLSEAVATQLRATGLTVLQHRQVPANDGGIAFGQVLVAMAAPPVTENL